MTFVIKRSKKPVYVSRVTWLRIRRSGVRNSAGVIYLLPKRPDRLYDPPSHIFCWYRNSFSGV